MDSTIKLAKTDKGREEIESRRYKLASRLRTLLILIDGTRTIDDIAADGRKLGAPDDALIVLMREGFVAPVNQVAAARLQAEAPVGQPNAAPAGEFARFRAAQQFMNETAVDNMGALKKFTFTLKLERCAVREDLAALVGDYEQSLTKAIGGEAATVLTKQLKGLLR